MTSEVQMKIRIPTEIHQRLKVAAAMHDVTMTSIIIEDLEARLKELEKKYTITHNE